MTHKHITLLLEATSSNMNMLRLEYLTSTVQVYMGDSPAQPTINLKNLPAWLRLLVT